MPKSSKKAKPLKVRQPNQQSTQIDFTLSDFADAPSPTAGKQCRVKKGAANAWKVNVKGLQGNTSQSKDELAWDEKDLSDFEVGAEGGGDNHEEEDVEEAENVQPPKAKMKKQVEVERFAGGKEYPLDIWFLVGACLEPQCVSVFSAICRNSHIVIHTFRFWNTLYKRYPADDLSLPLQLQPRFMSKVHGLRTRVVKILFLTYTPFIERIKAPVPFEEQIDTLESYMCTVMWYKRVKNGWHFFFKFKRRPRPPCHYSVPDRTQHLWNFEPDISNNEEEDNKVLQVVATNFMALPVVMGHTLQKSSISVGHAMRYHKLRLIFTQQNGKLVDKHSLESGVTMVIDPVINVRVLNWWDPEYPGNAGEPLASPTSPF